ARQFMPAIDGVDCVVGTRGFRALTPAFMRHVLRAAGGQRLIPLFVHSHGRGDHRVAFSPTDLDSHERGYSALLDISGQTVGALVLATDAAAGDIWTVDGGRARLEAAVIVGTNVIRLTPAPMNAIGHRAQDDR